MPTVDEISTWHSRIVGILSVALNVLLLFVIWFRSLKIIGAFKYIMMASTVLDIMFSAVCIVSSPTIASTKLLSSVMIVSGGVKLPYNCSMAIMIFFVFLLCESIITPLCMFVFRYLQICRSHYLTDHYRRVRYLAIMPAFISSSTCAMFCFAAWPTESDLLKFNEIASTINVKWDSPYLVASFHKEETAFDRAQSTTLYVVALYLVVIMISTIMLMIFCSTSIIRVVRRGTHEKTRRIQLQLYRSLLAQAIIPFLFIHIPFYLCVLAPLVQERRALNEDEDSLVCYKT
ncbi:hypothetical protein Q1695_006612 [Nippostrongylus brasiliensis]|nr:hypothetical protein Q1695_006612 [Nippostrongylus brasiliensis]